MTTDRFAKEDYVDDAIADLLDSAPGTLDTLNELAAALGDDANFATTTATTLGTKVPNTRTVNGHALSSDVTVTKGDVGLGNVDNTADSAKAFSGAQITSGTVVDARIDSAIARDSEVTSAVAAEAALARNADNLTSGTVADARIPSTIARDSEVTAAVAPLNTQAMIQAAKIAAAQAADLGYYVLTGLDFTPSATAGKLDRTSGTDLFAFVEGTGGTSATAIGSDVATLGAALVAGQEMWVNIEVGSTGTTFQNAGTPAAEGAAAIPDTTAGRNVHGWVYIPFSAVALNALDELLTVDNDKAKFIDARVVRSVSGFGASLNDDANAAAARTTLGLGTAATQASTAFDAAGAAAAAQAASQPLDSDLTTYAGITPGALGQAILPMTTLTSKGLVLGRGAAAPAALSPDAGTTKFLKNSVASGDPTWQAVAQADVSGLTTASSPTFAGLTVGNGTIAAPDIWVADTNTWVYASANSFTIAGVDATPYLFPGTKVSYDDGDGSVDYGCVASVTFSTDTTVTLIANSTHAIADPGGSHVLLSPRYYNGAANPKGYNKVFTWAPSILGYSSNPGTTAYRYSTMGNWITVVITEGADGTANATLRTYSAPVAAVTSTNAVWTYTCSLTDNGANLAACGQARMLSGGTVIDIFKDFAGTAFTNAAGSRVRAATVTYPF